MQMCAGNSGKWRYKDCKQAVVGGRFDKCPVLG